MKRALEEIGWRRVKDSKIYTYMNQRKGYFEVFNNYKNGLEIAIYEDGGLTICGGKYTDMEPQEVNALIEDIKSISMLQGEDEELLKKVTRPGSSANIPVSQYKLELIGKDKQECYRLIRKLLKDKFKEDVSDNLTYFIITFGRKMIEDQKAYDIKYCIYNSDNEHLRTRTYKSFEEVIDDIDKCSSLEQFISNER